MLVCSSWLLVPEFYGLDRASHTQFMRPWPGRLHTITTPTQYHRPSANHLCPVRHASGGDEPPGLCHFLMACVSLLALSLERSHRNACRIRPGASVCPVPTILWLASLATLLVLPYKQTDRRNGAACLCSCSSVPRASSWKRFGVDSSRTAGEPLPPVEDSSRVAPPAFSSCDDRHCAGPVPVPVSSPPVPSPQSQPSPVHRRPVFDSGSCWR
ncbi:hypothetical protein V8C26DRAFT_392794 [Trichoderma gracile]